jgi:dolichol-phosphate mannosyltransferase
MSKVDTFVSVVAPLFNAGALVADFAREAVAVLSATYTNYELVLVDDGSTDDTAQRAREVLAQQPCVRYLRLSRHFGMEIAITSGLDQVIGDFVVIMRPECDPPELIPQMVERARLGSGMVVGVRQDRSGEPLWYRAGARLFYALARPVLPAEMPRNGTDFRVLSRQVVNAVTRLKDKYRALRLLSLYVGFAHERFPYQPRWRGPPRSRRFGEALALAVGMVVTSSAHPLRLLAGLGLLASGLNLLYMLYVVAIFFFKDQVAEGWTTLSLQASGMFFLVFLILTALCEYVGRILEESRDRPLYYVVEEKNSNVLIADAERRNVSRNVANG